MFILRPHAPIPSMQGRYWRWDTYHHMSPYQALYDPLSARSLGNLQEDGQTTTDSGIFQEK